MSLAGGGVVPVGVDAAADNEIKCYIQPSVLGVCGWTIHPQTLGCRIYPKTIIGLIRDTGA